MRSGRTPEEEPAVDPEDGVQRSVRNFSPAAFRAARLRAGRSVADLADLAGLSASTLGGWERGVVQPTVRSLRGAAAALGVKIDDLLRPSTTAVSLADLRISHGLTFAEAAQAAGVSRNTVSRAENGHAGLSAVTARKLARVYEVDPAEVRTAWERVRAA